MNLYRLLRSNKESGPYSQDDIIALGFKPYDLIWVEGKSAGWRYPSEIPELKNFAPAIEEQPYDRFYKKPAVTVKETAQPSFAETTTTATRETSKADIAYQPQPALTVPGRHIHVTLPSGNKVNVTTINNNREPIQQRVIEPERISFAETIANANASQPTIKEIKPVAAIGETYPLKEEEAAPLHYYPAQTNSNFSWTTILGLFVGIATLVGLGIMIGLSINRNNSNIAIQQPVETKQKQIVPQPENSSPVQPVESTPLADNNQPQQSTQQQDNSIVNNAVVKKDIPVTNTNLKDDKSSSTANSQNPDAVKQEVAGAETRTALKRNAIILPAVNIEKQLNVKTNVYKVGAFGGITDLQCTLVNDSKFALDMVEVEVQYIQANDKVYKTETIAFKDIAAGAQITLNAPKSTRGIKVISKITKVSTKESGLSKI